METDPRDSSLACTSMACGSPRAATWRWISSSRSVFFLTSKVMAVFSRMRSLRSSVFFSVWMAISEATVSARLAAIKRAAACTPASIERNRFSRM
jgi:hypothetical protein